MSRAIILAALAFLLGVTFTSCDNCRGFLGKPKIECSNGGTCNDGVCECLKGYSGTNCEEKDFCELNDVICIYGECLDGICTCSDGFEGQDCGTATRAKFIGKYQMTERCDDLDTAANHELTIEENILEPSRMYIYNLFNYNQFPINGFYSKIDAVPTPNSNEFYIPEQQPDGDSRSIRGSGSITVIDSVTSKLNIDYIYKNKNNKEYTCTLEATLKP